MNIIHRWVQLLIRLWVSWFGVRVNMSLLVWGIIGSYSTEEWCCLVLKFNYTYKVIYRYLVSKGADNSCILTSLALPRVQDLAYRIDLVNGWHSSKVWKVRGKLNNCSLAEAPGRHMGRQHTWNLQWLSGELLQNACFCASSSGVHRCQLPCSPAFSEFLKISSLLTFSLQFFQKLVNIQCTFIILFLLKMASDFWSDLPLINTCFPFFSHTLQYACALPSEMWFRRCSRKKA